MKLMELKINKDFGFTTTKSLTAKMSKLALDKYFADIEDVLKLNVDYPIFLDTSILLSYYGMSQVEKNKLTDFIIKTKAKIIITKQVEKEFLNNRVAAIKKDFFEPLTKVKTDYEELQNGIKNQFKKYKEEKKRILSNDYVALWDDLVKIEETVVNVLSDHGLIKKMKEGLEQFNQKNKGVLFKDEMLNIVSSIEVYDKLSDDEISFIKSEFDILLKTYEAAKESIKWKSSFPGCGEKKDYPYGDFIIYHEILKFMKENNSSCIFLTNDVTKGDWLQRDKNPYIHYIENTYLNTENVIFIVEGERSLPAISFENIHGGQLEILHATYGSNELDKQIDVTSILRSQILNNKLTITSSNDIAGDPQYGVLKELVIAYRIGKEEFKITIIEGATETIPEE